VAARPGLAAQREPTRRWPTGRIESRLHRRPHGAARPLLGPSLFNTVRRPDQHWSRHEDVEANLSSPLEKRYRRALRTIQALHDQTQGSLIPGECVDAATLLSLEAIGQWEIGWQAAGFDPIATSLLGGRSQSHARIIVQRLEREMIPRLVTLIAGPPEAANEELGERRFREQVRVVYAACRRRPDERPHRMGARRTRSASRGRSTASRRGPPGRPRPRRQADSRRPR
jgi:hypothetical protein